MHTEKYGIGNCGLLNEADRTMYGRQDTSSRSIIDRERTCQNYNLCPHEQYTKKEIREIHERIRGKKFAKNAVAFGCTVITLPEDYTGDQHDFFQTAYDGLKKLYGLKDEDVVSCYVHMDETTPHMHFYFLPVHHEEEKDSMSWDKVMPRKMYKTQHAKLQKYMEDVLHTPVNLLNGETLGINVQQLTPQQKEASIRLQATKKELKNARDALETVQIATSEARGEYESLRAKAEKIVDTIFKPYIEIVDALHKQLSMMTPREQEKEKSVFDMLEKSKRIFGKGNHEEIRKVTKELREESSRIESEYSLDDDDDFER